MRDLTIGSYRNFWPQLAVALMSLYLLTDMLSGFSIIYLGVDIKASFVYKVPLLMLILGLVAQQNMLKFNILLIFILLIFIGPLYQFYGHARLDFFINDFSTAIKILTPVCVFVLYREWYKSSPEFALASTHKILKYGFIILSINFIIGALGFGKSTYDFGKGETAGSTGMIMAGNELGGAFVVAFTYMLHMCWNHKSKKWYLLLSLFTVFCGVSVSTKTTILASILIVFLVPIVNERHKLYSLTLLKIKIFVPIITLIIIAVILAVEMLQSLGLYDRMVFLYKKAGIFGIILSGRDVMVSQNLDLVFHHSTLFEQLFGQGEALSLKRTVGSAASEVDGVDIFNLYGLFTFLAVFSFYFYTFTKAHSQTVKNINFLSPFVLLASFTLLALSQLSGHIWNSGTAGILIGVMLGALNTKEKGY
ncbi:O-antigen ligase family protein [Pseudoalteromonas distincta]|uniref:O-antigen ligase family protein n=1 Tax=Pseudoalteromonas distincta TaxID=77608 RepID=UPI0032E0C8AB